MICTLTLLRRVDLTEFRDFLPDNIPHQEAERIPRRGAEALSIYCYL